MLVLDLYGRPASAFTIYTVGAGCPYTTIQDAVNAAAANPGEDYVWIANNKIYSAQHIVVSDADGVDIEGGFSDCNDYRPAEPWRSRWLPGSASSYKSHLRKPPDTADDDHTRECTER